MHTHDSVEPAQVTRDLLLISKSSTDMCQPGWEGHFGENGQEAQETCSIPGLGDSLEYEMATHSSILEKSMDSLGQSMKSPWTEEPGGLQSKGS